jgi:hypothetical protein
MNNDGMQLGEDYYMPCEDCDGDHKCKTCNSTGWIKSDDDWHPYKKDFDDYDKRERHGYFDLVVCSNCGHKISVLYEFNIVDEQYHPDCVLCPVCDNQLVKEK